MGPLWTELLVSRAFFCISLEPSFVSLSKSTVNDHLPGSPTGEKCLFPKPSWTYPSGSSVKGPPPGSPYRPPTDRNAPFPEASIMCLSRVPSNCNPSSGLLKTELPISRAFFYVSLCFPSKSPPDRKISSLCWSSWERSIPSMFPKTGALWKKTPVSRALFNISFWAPSKEVLPLGPPHRKRRSISRALFHLSLKVPGKWAPLQVSQRGPNGESCPFRESSFTHPSGSPVKQPPLQVSLTELPYRDTLHFHSPSSVSQGYQQMNSHPQVPQ